MRSRHGQLRRSSRRRMPDHIRTRRCAPRLWQIALHSLRRNPPLPPGYSGDPDCSGNRAEFQDPPSLY